VVEFDRSVVVASTTGVSAIVRPNGSVVVSTGTWRRAEIEARVPLRTSMTISDRIGGWPEVGLSRPVSIARSARASSLPCPARRCGPLACPVRSRDLLGPQFGQR
jgi:apolipoprotein N-acyltransferase